MMFCGWAVTSPEPIRMDASGISVEQDPLPLHRALTHQTLADAEPPGFARLGPVGVTGELLQDRRAVGFVQHVHHALLGVH